MGVCLHMCISSTSYAVNPVQSIQLVMIKLCCTNIQFKFIGHGATQSKSCFGSQLSFILPYQKMDLEQGCAFSWKSQLKKNNIKQMKTLRMFGPSEDCAGTCGQYVLLFCSQKSAGLYTLFSKKHIVVRIENKQSKKQ